MHRRLKIWILVAAGALLLIAAALVHTTASRAAAACNTASGNEGTASPIKAAQQGTPTDLALVQAAGEGCLDCHADQEKLKALAVEEETAESLSEGPG
ncbi:MAG: hypothetical protein ACUVSU_03545 [Aggregatilineaceae bacterium]